MKLWKLIIAVTGIIVVCFLCGLPTWGAQPKADTLTFAISTDGGKLILTPSLPSKLRIISSGPSTGTGLAAVVIGGLPDFADWKLVVTVGGTPNPEPQPNPSPVPPPVPVPTVLFGIVVEESRERTPAQAVVLTSPKVDDLFKPNKGSFRVVDGWKDDGSKRDLGDVLNKYRDRSDELKVRPMLFVVDPAGFVYAEVKLPAKVADVEALVAKIRGGEKP